MRLTTKVSTNNCHLILVRFGDLGAVRSRQCGNASFTTSWHLLHPSKYTSANLSFSKTVHTLLENLQGARIMYIDVSALTFHMTRPGSLNFQLSQNLGSAFYSKENTLIELSPATATPKGSK